MTMRLDIDRKSNHTSAVLAAVLLLGSGLAAGAQETQLASMTRGGVRGSAVGSRPAVTP